MRRHGVKAQHRPAAIAVLVGAVLVGMTRHGRVPIMRVSRDLGIAVTELMPVMAMLVVVAVLMLLGVLVSRQGFVGALSHYFGEAGRKRRGDGRRQRPEQIRDGDEPPPPSARRPSEANHPIYRHSED